MKKPERRTGESRSTFERLIALCIALTSASAGNNQLRLARRFEVSPKTIQRDFEFIRDRLMVPMEYNPHTFRWELKSPDAVRRIESIGAVFANLH